MHCSLHRLLHYSLVLTCTFSLAGIFGGVEAALASHLEGLDDDVSYSSKESRNYVYSSISTHERTARAWRVQVTSQVTPHASKMTEANGKDVRSGLVRSASLHAACSYGAHHLKRSQTGRWRAERKRAAAWTVRARSYQVCGCFCFSKTPRFASCIRGQARCAFQHFLKAVRERGPLFGGGG